MSRTRVLRLPRLYAKQRAAIFSTARYAIIEASTKAGKAQPLHASVYTPTGPKRMGDIRVGDEVLNADGGASKVTGVYPQGLRPMRRVKFSDGSTVECDLEHLWEVHQFGAKKQVLTTRQVADMSEYKRSRCWVPAIEPVGFSAQDVPLDPYLIGVLLGDGGFTTETVRFSSADNEIMESVRSLIPSGHSVKSMGGCDWNITAGKHAPSLRERGKHIRGICAKLGLVGKYSHEKFVPNVYKYNSIEVRRAVLQGLLDTDGFVDKHGQPGIEQTSAQLARDITELVASLGGTVLTTYRAENAYTKDGVRVPCRPVWRQRIRFSDARWCFRLGRKARLVRPKAKTGNRMFRSIEDAGTEEMQCIRVDHPRHLYLTDGLVPTHNTVGCIAWILSEAWTKGKPGRNWWWIAPIFSTAKIAYRRVRRIMHRADPKKEIWDSNDTDLRIHFKEQDCDIWFKGSDDPDSLYGEDVHGAVIDEASRCKEEAWHAIRSTLTATRGPVRIIGNVKGRKNWSYKLGQMAKAGAPDMSYAKLTAYDAVEGGVLRAEEIEDAKRLLPEKVFNELYLAEPSDDGGNPFGLAHIAKARRKIENPGPVYQRGIDLAKKQDYTVNLGIDEKGQMVDFQRWQKIPWDETTMQLAQSIGDSNALVDSTGVGDAIVDGLQKKCSNVEGYIFSLPSKQRLMECLAVAIQSGEFTYDNDVLQAELEIFEYEVTRTGVRYTAPEGFHDDCVYAAGLACYGAKMRPRPYFDSSALPKVENQHSEGVNRWLSGE